MSLFVFSVIAGLLIHQLISIIQLTQGGIGHRIVHIRRDIIFSIRETAYVQWKAGLSTALLVLFIVIVLLLVAQGVHPSEGYAFRFTDALLSPRIAAVFFGFLVGLLIGNVVNRIFRGDHERQLNSRDWMEILLIVILLILGIGGEELIRSYASRIASISFGTTNTISFTESKSGSRATEQASTPIRQAGKQQSDYLPARGSIGLARATGITSTIERDVAYLDLIGKYERPQAQVGHSDSFLVHAHTFAALTISPLGSCLGAIAARTGDVNYLNSNLASLAGMFRSLADPAGADDVWNLVKNSYLEIWKRAYETGLKMLLNRPGENPTFAEDETAYLRGCSPLAALLCGPIRVPDDLAGTGNSWLEQHIIAVRKRAELIEESPSCLEIRFDDVNALKSEHPQVYKELLQDLEKREVARLRDAVKAIADNLDESKRRPHFAIAHAGLLMQLGFNDSAAQLLHDWINGPIKDRQGLPWTWYRLRARIAIGGYLEEWITSLPDNVPQYLRQYQIDNWERVIGEMKELRWLAEAQRASGEARIERGAFSMFHSGDDGQCNASNQGDAELLGKLFESYIGALTGYIDHSLKHAISKSRSASSITRHADELIKIGLRCVNSEVRPELRAEILELYVRNQLNIVENTASLRTNDSRRQQLAAAHEVLRLAIEMLDRPQSRIRADRDKHPSFRKEVPGATLVNRYELLLETRNRLLEAADRIPP